MTSRPPRLKEIDIQRACVDFMRLDGWRPLRTDPCSDRGRGKGFGEKGMADHLFVRYAIAMSRRAGFKPKPDTKEISWGQILWVEFKRPAGTDTNGRHCAATKATGHQLSWHLEERHAGALTAIAGQDFEPTYEGFVDWYRKSGLLCRVGL